MSSAEKLPVVDPRVQPALGARDTRSKRAVSRVLQAVALFYCVYFVARAQPWLHREDLFTIPGLGVPKSIQKAWGQYSPWFPLGKYVPPPKECTITQVNILHRHGARYPDPDDGEKYQMSITRLASADKFRESRFDFLKNYTYDLGVDDLLPIGAWQTVESAEAAFLRYGHLLPEGEVPFVRASSKPRVIATASNWTIGFALASRQRINPIVNEILSEAINDTLNNDCPNGKSGKSEMHTWVDVFAPPIAKRLNKAAPGANLKPEDAYNLMAACPFETLAHEKKSPFCDLFTEEEFLAFEYNGDVEKYYKTGYGDPLGAVQGVGYVNELLARLTDSEVEDHTTHNASLPFPLGKTLYADFTHENLMVAVYSAMGLFNISEPLDPQKMPAVGRKHREWVASKTVPFSARMVTERLACGEDGEQFVRVFVNDALQPLGFCGADKNRMCTLEDFVQSQGYARRSGDGDFEKCYN